MCDVRSKRFVGTVEVFKLHLGCREAAEEAAEQEAGVEVSLLDRGFVCRHLPLSHRGPVLMTDELMLHRERRGTAHVEAVFGFVRLLASSDGELTLPWRLRAECDLEVGTHGLIRYSSRFTLDEKEIPLLIASAAILEGIWLYLTSGSFGTLWSVPS